MTYRIYQQRESRSSSPAEMSFPQLHAHRPLTSKAKHTPQIHIYILLDTPFSTIWSTEYSQIQPAPAASSCSSLLQKKMEVSSGENIYVYIYTLIGTVHTQPDHSIPFLLFLHVSFCPNNSILWYSFQNIFSPDTISLLTELSLKSSKSKPWQIWLASILAYWLSVPLIIQIISSICLEQ